MGLEVVAITPIRAESLLEGVLAGVVVVVVVAVVLLGVAVVLIADEVEVALIFLTGVEVVPVVVLLGVVADKVFILGAGGGISGLLKFCTDFKTLPLFS